MPAEPYEKIREGAIKKYGVKEGERLMKLYEDTVHVRNKHVKGSQKFFDYVHEWERACRRLKNSGVDLSRIVIVERG